MPIIVSICGYSIAAGIIFTMPALILIGIWQEFDMILTTVIAFTGGFHGRTYLAMGLTGKEKPYKEGFGPFPEFIHHVPYPYEYRGITDEFVISEIKSLFEKALCISEQILGRILAVTEIHPCPPFII